MSDAPSNAAGAYGDAPNPNAPPPAPTADPRAASGGALGDDQLEAVGGGADLVSDLAEACFDWARRTFGPPTLK